MRTEIHITNFNGDAYLKASPVQPLAIDATNGMRLPIDYRGVSGFLVSVKNTGTKQKSITVLATAPHLGASPRIVNIPAGETALLTRFDAAWFGSHGGIDFDFEVGFKGEIAAFRLPDNG